MDEFEYLDQCWSKWEKIPEKMRRRGQEAVVDVCGALGGVESEGLIQVWQVWGDAMPRLIESFRMAGADEIAKMLEESGFCREIIAKSPEGAEPEGTPEQEKRLLEIQIQISDLGPDAREGLLKFLPKTRGGQG